MTRESGGEPLLEFLAEPSFILRRHGEILNANASARRLLEMDPCSCNLFDFVLSPHDDLDRYLSLCSGTTSPLIGTVVLRNGNASTRLRIHCARLREADPKPRLGLRCLTESDDHFAVLSERVRDLNRQLGERRREKALLEEALSQTTVLMRELQHRVKNNIQMMMSLITVSARGKNDPLLEEFVDAARLRLQAMASAQDAIHRSRSIASVDARPFLEPLVRAIVRSVGPEAELKLEIADVVLPSTKAHAISLIVNELVMNAAKHGLGRDGGTVLVALEPAGDELLLVVQDDGPGIGPDAASRSSGLRLVRGLCRQIGGSLDMRVQNGTRCTIRFDHGCEAGDVARVR